MDTKTTIPLAGSPFTSGNIVTEAWFRFLLMLFNRTGGSDGGDLKIVRKDIEDLQAAIASQDYGGAIASLQSALDKVPQEVSNSSLFDIFSSHIQDLYARQESLVSLIQLPAETPPFDVFSHGSLEGGDLHSVVTPTVSGFMSAPDKAKLNFLPNLIVSSTAITADIVASNSTADVNIFSISLPANSLQIGSTFLNSFTLFANAAASSGTFNIWVKVGATKVLTATFTVPALGLTNQAIVSVFRFTVRTIGTSGTFQVSGNNNGNSTLFTSGIVINTASGSIDTTASNTISIGMNWSVANVGNVATVKTGLLNQEK